MINLNVPHRCPQVWSKAWTRLWKFFSLIKIKQNKTIGNDIVQLERSYPKRFPLSIHFESVERKNNEGNFSETMNLWFWLWLSSKSKPIPTKTSDDNVSFSSIEDLVWTTSVDKQNFLSRRMISMIQFDVNGNQPSERKKSKILLTFYQIGSNHIEYRIVSFLFLWQFGERQVRWQYLFVNRFAFLKIMFYDHVNFYWTTWVNIITWSFSSWLLFFKRVSVELVTVKIKITTTTIAIARRK